MYPYRAYIIIIVLLSPSEHVTYTVCIVLCYAVLCCAVPPGATVFKVSRADTAPTVWVLSRENAVKTGLQDKTGSKTTHQSAVNSNTSGAEYATERAQW